MQSDAKTKDQGYFLTIALLAFGYVVLRAVHVPLIHDEANSFWWYARTGEFIPYRSHENTGNHVLSSFLGWIGHGLFGPEPWAVRWGSVLAFPLYAWSCRGLVVTIDGTLVRRTVLLALLWCPFVLDYFALFRGYGVGLACATWAVLHAVRMAYRPRLGTAVCVALGMAAATLSNLSYVTVWLVLAGIVLSIAFLRRPAAQGPWWGWTLLVVFQAAGAWAVVRLVQHYTDLGQLDFGHREGFLGGTMAELFRYVSGVEGPVLAPAITVLVLLATAAAVVAARHDHRWCAPLLLLCAVWWGEIAVRGCLSLLGIMAPPARAALYMVPLTLLVLGHALDRVAMVRPPARWAVLLLLLLPFRSIERIGFATVLGSEEQAVPPRFAQYAVRLQASLGRPVMTGIRGALFPTWAYQLFRTGAHVNDAQPENELQDQDLRLLPAGAPEADRAGYHLVEEVPEDRLQLYERDVTLDLVPVVDTLLPDRAGGEEQVWIYDPDGRFADTALWVRLEGRLSTSARVMNVQFITAESVERGFAAYEESMLWHERQQWQGQAFDVMRQLPARKGATGRAAYLWNVTSAHLELSGLRLRVYRKASSGRSPDAAP